MASPPKRAKASQPATEAAEVVLAQKELAPGLATAPAKARVTETDNLNGAPARARETPQPQAPDSARREGKEGRVLLRVLVDEDGRTKAIEVNQSSGHDMLDRAATEAIKKWRFVPARAGGKPIETWVKVPIEFQLSNAKP
jgi:protein TonB